jgi:hypothetical protein
MMEHEERATMSGLLTAWSFVRDAGWKDLRHLGNERLRELQQAVRASLSHRLEDLQRGVSTMAQAS